MTEQKRSTRKKQSATSSRNALKNDAHFVSLLAHRLEEAHVNLYDALQQDLPPKAHELLQRVDDDVKRLARWEAKRQGHEGIYE